MTTEQLDLDAVFPSKLSGLFEPHRYKILYGGRGSTKSWSIARALLLMGQVNPLRILCGREFQQSISDSVWRLLVDQITMLGLEDFYEIERVTIRGNNGTEFRFVGLKSNIHQIKSFEGIDIAWIEEAANVSHDSWRTLIPTLRKEGSELWVSFNPRYETDATYQFVIRPPDDALILNLSWRDNPWFSDTLRSEMESLKRRNLQDYLHVYEGHFLTYLEGAVYIDELTQAEEEGRITRVPYDAAAPVDVFFDLGFADFTAAWVVQRVQFETHFIHYIEDQRKPIDHYLKELSLLPYPIDHIHLPHDARAKSLGTGKSVEEIIRGKGYKTSIVPNLSVVDGINAVRQQLFPNLWIDRDRCEKGIMALRHYRFDIAENQGGAFKNAPVHDRFSHGSDACRYVAVGMRPPKAKVQIKPNYEPMFAGDQSGWMRG